MRTDSKFHCKYIYGAVACASSKLKLYRRIAKIKPDAKIPHIAKNHLVIYNESCKIENGVLRIPTEPKKYVYIKLAKHIQDKIKDQKIGRFVLTDDKLAISYSKVVLEQKPANYVGIDRNLDNVTSFDSQGNQIAYDLSKAQQIIGSYTTVKRKFKRNDVRIRKKIFQKYGKLQKNKVHNILHRTSKKIVSQNSGIIMENLKGIRKLYRKGNGKVESIDER